MSKAWVLPSIAANATIEGANNMANEYSVENDRSYLENVLTATSPSSSAKSPPRNKVTPDLNLTKLNSSNQRQNSPPHASNAKKLQRSASTSAAVSSKDKLKNDTAALSKSMIVGPSLLTASSSPSLSHKFGMDDSMLFSNSESLFIQEQEDLDSNKSSNKSSTMSATDSIINSINKINASSVSVNTKSNISFKVSDFKGFKKQAPAQKQEVAVASDVSKSTPVDASSKANNSVVAPTNKNEGQGVAVVKSIAGSKSKKPKAAKEPLEEPGGFYFPALFVGGAAVDFANPDEDTAEDAAATTTSEEANTNSN
jgi:hypothetical protein